MFKKITFRLASAEPAVLKVLSKSKKRKKTKTMLKSKLNSRTGNGKEKAGSRRHRRNR
jgi:hypothetical protein